MKYAVQTSVGKKYTRMEDAYVLPLPNKKYDVPAPDVKRKGHLFVLADGMGGAKSGDVAGELTANWLFREYYQSNENRADINETIAGCIKNVNKKIYSLAREHKDYNGMGATLLAAVFVNGRVCISSVGDSRLYLFRENELEQITEDHSEVWNLYKAGEIAKDDIRSHPRKNVVTAVIGNDESVDINQYEMDVRSNDIFLLCSDGLTDMVPESDIVRILNKSGSLHNMAKKMVKKANEYGGRDNITVMLIRPQGEKSVWKSFGNVFKPRRSPRITKKTSS